MTISESDLKNKKLGVISNDAGGAHILAAYLFTKKITPKFILSGPAIAVFKSYFGNNIKIEKDISSALEKCDIYLSGTGWHSNFEYLGIQKAKENKKTVIAYLDHWVNYSERFIRNDIQVLPDCIWIGDKFGETICKKEFIDIDIILVDNEYFKIATRRYKEEVLISSIETFDFMFISEALSQGAKNFKGEENYYGYTELDAYRLFLKSLRGSPEKTILVRLHPSDNHGKYDQISMNYPNKIIVSKENDLIKDLVRCKCVVGCNSMALYIAFLCGKKVLTAIPEGLASMLPAEIFIKRNK